MTSDVQPDPGGFDGREHLLPVRVYYEDTDFTGVVYHANYLRYFERGRSDFLRAVFGGHTVLLEREDPLAFVIVRMLVEWRKPARIDDGLLVRTAYDAIQGARLEIRQRIMRGPDLICEAEVTAACIDLKARPRKPPRSLVEGLTPWLKPLTP